ERQEARLAELEARRDAAAEGLSAQRAELAALLRAAHTVGGHAPLKLLLAQDDVAGANRSLAYHGYLQRGRSARIAALSAELAGLEAMEREIASERATLAETRERQKAQAEALARQQAERARALAELDARYRDRSERGKALGTDARAPERLRAPAPARPSACWRSCARPRARPKPPAAPRRRAKRRPGAPPGAAPRGAAPAGRAAAARCRARRRSPWRAPPPCRWADCRGRCRARCWPAMARACPTAARARACWWRPRPAPRSPRWPTARSGSRNG